MNYHIQILNPQQPMKNIKSAEEILKDNRIVLEYVAALKEWTVLSGKVKDLKKAMKEYASQFQPESKWISVDERLPKYGAFLCAHLDDWCTICYTDIDFTSHMPNGDHVFLGWKNQDTHERVYPTHWMPLPEPPTDNK
jgi:hypothetical protein